MELTSKSLPGKLFCCGELLVNGAKDKAGDKHHSRVRDAMSVAGEELKITRPVSCKNLGKLVVAKRIEMELEIDQDTIRSATG
jgi:hypothetical protein